MTCHWPWSGRGPVPTSFLSHSQQISPPPSSTAQALSLSTSLFRNFRYVLHPGCSLPIPQNIHIFLAFVNYSISAVTGTVQGHLQLTVFSSSAPGVNFFTASNSSQLTPQDFLCVQSQNRWIHGQLLFLPHNILLSYCTDKNFYHHKN